MRDLLFKNYKVLKNMLWQTHEMFESTVLLTKNYKTSQFAYDLLEKIIKRKCEKEYMLDHGLKLLPNTRLFIADTEKWLIQPELKAINDKLTYTTRYGKGEKKQKWKYRGYIDRNG